MVDGLVRTPLILFYSLLFLAVQSEGPLEFSELFVTSDFVSDCDTTYTSISQKVSTSKKI